MKIAIIGRTRMLAETGRQLISRGHTISIVVTCPPDDGTDDLSRLAAEAGCDFITTTRINDDAMAMRLRLLACDVGVSVNWNGLLKPAALSLFRFGVLNAHAGDLPRYRGNAVINWAILKKESHVGLCIHEMAEELDAGPVYVRDTFPLTTETYVGEVYNWVATRVPSMFIEAIDRIQSGLPPSPQVGTPLRCYPRRPDDSRIDWSQSTSDIHALIRASSRPYSGAFSFLEDGRTVRIWRADLVASDVTHVATTGQYCYRNAEYPVIACGDGLLMITEASIDGSDVDALAEIGASVRRRLHINAPINSAHKS